MKNLTAGKATFNSADEKFEALFSNDVELCKFANKLNKKDTLLGLGIGICAYGIYKLRKKCKVQKAHIETLEARVDALSNTIMPKEAIKGTGKETNECNA